MKQKPKFYHCGCCDHYHPDDFWGDCRDDERRFTLDQLEELYGADGWEETAMVPGEDFVS